MTESRAEPQFSRRGLREATLEGVRWVTLARALAESAAFCSGVVLAHLVPPEEFGRLAVTVIVNELALALTAEGIGNALVQRRNVDRQHLESATLVALCVGIVLAFATFLLAPPVAGALFGDRTADLFRLFSPAFVIAGLRVVPQARLQRRLEFRRLSVIEITGTLAGVGMSVALAAVAGLDAEAYILGILTSGVVAVGLMFAAAGGVRPRWHGAEGRQLLDYGVPAGLAGISWVANRNIDYAVVAARLGPAQAGFYYRAYTLGAESEQRISGIIARILLPVYSRTSNLQHLRDVRTRIVRVNASLIFPLLALFVALAPVGVPWLFGARWEPAVVPAQLLAVGGMALTVSFGTGALILAAGRPRALSIFNLGQLLLYAATVFVASSFGLTTVCAAVACFQWASLAASYRLLVQPIVAVPLSELARDLAPATISSMLLLAVVLPLVSLLSSASIAVVPLLACVCSAGLLTYLVTLRGLFRPAWSDLALLVRRTVRGSGAPGGAPVSANA